MRSLQPLQTLALAVASLFALCNVAYTLAFWAVRGEYDAAVDDRQSASEVWTWADWLALPLWGSMLLAYVVTCIWLWRARKNAVALTGDPSAHRRRRKWVWLGWWMPIVSLWFPFQVVRDVLNESQHDERPRLRPNGTFLGCWWVTWLLYAVLSWVSAWRLGSDSRLTDDAVTATGVLLTISSVLIVIGVLLWTRIILLIGSAQRELAARQGRAMA